MFANNGEDAVNLYKTIKGFDLILMDLSMPRLDGHGALKAILEHNPKAKVIAQTAHAMQEEKTKCLKAGFIDYLSKPIDKDLLLETVKKWI